ncbi:MAG: ABC transporter substrate-binding protein, partial [Bacteroidales bacterium]|nr:ABC transporter substrate-binding protein [Bacteroidales bacterium]
MKRKLATIMFILCFLGTACSNVSLDSSELKEPIEEENLESPQYGGTINLATTSKLDLDPLKANDDEIKGVLSLIYEGLVYIDGQGMVQPALTESWQIGDNGRTYVMKLRTDVKWHNGEDFSASDVKATFDKILELKKQRDFRTEFLEFDNIQSYEASDKNTFTISLSKPDANFLYRMDRGILPKSLLETVEVNEGQNIEEPVSEFIGTGPFIVTDRSGDLINLKRNEDYFGEIPYIEKINIRIYPDELSIKEAFTKGDIDIITIEPMDWNVFQEMEDVYLLQTPSRYLEFLAVNLNNPILNDVKVRQAMLMGIDRNRILQDTVIGRGLAMDGPVFPYSWAFNSQIQPIPHNKKRAAQLLESAGWETE